jgi:hypothetical protein
VTILLAAAAATAALDLFSKQVALNSLAAADRPGHLAWQIIDAAIQNRI